MSRQIFVYILASQRNGTLYTGVTSDLLKRIYEHKAKVHTDSFTAKYTVDKLVWFEAGENIEAAIELEKKIKNRNRAWKIALIEKQNPKWDDLSADFLDSATALHAAQNDEDEA
jgi:putative endonuclease